MRSLTRLYQSVVSSNTFFWAWNCVYDIMTYIGPTRLQTWMILPFPPSHDLEFFLTHCLEPTILKRIGSIFTTKQLELARLDSIPIKISCLKSTSEMPCVHLLHLHRESPRARPEFKPYLQVKESVQGNNVRALTYTAQSTEKVRMPADKILYLYNNLVAIAQLGIATVSCGIFEDRAILIITISGIILSSVSASLPLRRRKK